MADGSLGIGVVGDMHPQGGAAVAGIPEVELDGGWVVGDGADDAAGDGALGEEPLVVVQDLPAGVDPQVGPGEPSFGQCRLGLLGVVSILEDGDQVLRSRRGF
jgi:hypothetical protein